MSVRAYLVHEDEKIIDGKRYVHEDLEFLWNNWSESEIWDILYGYMNDMTNEDCIGEIEITIYSWEELKEKYEESNQSKLYKIINQYKDVFQKLDTHFKAGNDWARIKMF